MKQNLFFEHVLTYQGLNENCSIWVASVLSLTFFSAIENRISRFKSGSFPPAAKTFLSCDYDVLNCETRKQWRARLRRNLKAKKGGSYCVAGAPNDVSCKNNTYTTGVSIHYFPKNEAVGQKWVRFVRRHRKDFTPSNSSVLCSVHFEDSCFEYRPIAVPRENGEFIQLKKRLISGSIPTRDTVIPHSSPLTSPKRRRVSLFSHMLHVHVLIKQ